MACTHGAAARKRGGKLCDALGANVFALFTYGRLGATLRTPRSTAGVQPLPALGDEPLGVSEETLRVIEALAERRSVYGSIVAE